MSRETAATVCTEGLSLHCPSRGRLLFLEEEKKHDHYPHVLPRIKDAGTDIISCSGLQEALKVRRQHPVGALHPGLQC